MKLESHIPSSKALIEKHGLQQGGAVQKLIDSETMRYMSDYMPRRQVGALEHAMLMSTVVGSGEINIPVKYAHYLHEGVLYVSPTTGSAWAKRDEIKVPTDRELTYAGAPMRGKKFFDRMKADNKTDILEAAQAMVDKGGTG